MPCTVEARSSKLVAVQVGVIHTHYVHRHRKQSKAPCAQHPQGAMVGVDVSKPCTRGSHSLRPKPCSSQQKSVALRRWA